MRGKSKNVQKGWGKEEWIVNNRYCLKKLTVLCEKRCSTHFHADKTETFYILEGILFLYVIDTNIGKETLITMMPGQSYTLSPLCPHWFTTPSERCVFIEASSHHEDSDSYRVQPGNSQRKQV